jgi:hypothetical protein
MRIRRRQDNFQSIYATPTPAPYKVSAPQEKRELTEEEKAIREIQALFTGEKTSIHITDRKESNNNNSAQSCPIPERLKEYKDTMGDKLVIGSVPKHNQSKGVKL